MEFAVSRAEPGAYPGTYAQPLNVFLVSLKDLSIVAVQKRLECYKEKLCEMVQFR